MCCLTQMLPVQSVGSPVTLLFCYQLKATQVVIFPSSL